MFLGVKCMCTGIRLFFIDQHSYVTIEDLNRMIRGHDAIGSTMNSQNVKTHITNHNLQSLHTQ